MDYELLLPPIEQEEHIAPLIHQTCKSRASLPQEIKDNISYLQQNNPHWTYRLWEDEDIEAFIRQYYGDQILTYYLRIHPAYGAARADLFRYLLIYRLGGLYLDLKSSLTRPLSEILLPTDRYILSHWDNLVGMEHEGAGMHSDLNNADFPRGEYQQFHVCAVAGHPFLRKVIIDVLRHIDDYNIFHIGVGATAVFRTTGPISYSKSIRDAINQFNEHAQSTYRVVDGAYEDSGILYSIYSSWDKHSTAIKSGYRTAIQPLITDTPKWSSFLYNLWVKLYRSAYWCYKLIGRK